MLAILERLDHQLFFAVNHGLSTLGLDYVFWVVSALGYGVVLVSLAGIGLWWRDRQTFKQHFGWLILAVLVGAGLVQVLKFGYARPRPLGEFAALVQAGEAYINIIGRQLRHRSFPSGHAQAATSVSPTFGQHNEDILQDLLGMDGADYQGLVDDAVVATVPTTGEPSPRIPESESLERGMIADWDPDYLNNLGLV